MLGLQIFKNDEFNIRVIDGLFVGKDVARCLGYKAPENAVKRHVEEEDKTVKQIPQHRNGGLVTNAVLINESGLYSLVLSSKLESAKRFKRWVTSEVLPSIRQNGLYATNDIVEKIINDPNFGIQLLQNYAKTKEENKKLSAKCEFVDRFMSCKSSILMRDYAKLLLNADIIMGEKRLYKWMRLNGYLMENNKPYQHYIEAGLFKLKEALIEKPNTSFIAFTTMVTPKGQKYFYDKLKGVTNDTN